MKRSDSLADVADSIRRMYDALVGRQSTAAARNAGQLLGRRLLLLDRLARGELGPDTLDQPEALGVQEALLDAITLQIAAGGRDGVFSDFWIKDPALVGRARLRRSKMLESDDAQLDWHFQVLVQAWSSAHSQEPVKDLQNDARFRKRPACDFAIYRSDGRVELLEAKRFHPEGSDHDGSLSSVVSKLAARVPDAVNQLNSTAEVIGKDRCDRHLLIDLTAYGQSESESTQGGLHVKEIGVRQEDLNAIVGAIEPLIEDADKLTLCWNSYVAVDGRSCAIVQRTYSPTPKRNQVLDYAGWTVEAYPLRQREYREMRVSSVARSMSWIVASYNNLRSPETFVRIGPEMRVE